MQLAELVWIIIRDGSLGFLVGILIGLTGIGGGAVIQPILIIVLGLTPISAVGTGLLFTMISKIGGVCMHIRMRNIRPRRTLCFLCGGVPSVLIVPYAVNRLILQYGATTINHYLQCSIALVMLATATFMLLQHLFLRKKLRLKPKSIVAAVHSRSGISWQPLPPGVLLAR